MQSTENNASNLKNWRTLKKQEEQYIQGFENKCIKKLLWITRTKMTTTEQAYILVNTNKQLLSHVRSHKLWYFSHMMRQPHDSSENTVMTGLVKGSRSHGRPKNVSVWQHHDMDWLVGIQIVACHKWQRVLEFCYSSMQPMLQGNDGDMTWNDMLAIFRFILYSTGRPCSCWRSMWEADWWILSMTCTKRFWAVWSLEMFFRVVP